MPRAPLPLALLPLALAAVALSPGALRAQDHTAHDSHSPYVGLTTRAIKSLSEEDVASLEEGRGMGYALAAELNGVPGPLHSLELAEALELDDAQRSRLESLRQAMTERAQELGRRLIDLEADLDRRFAHRHLGPDELVRLTAEIGAVEGELRAVHLQAHLDTVEILTAEQTEAYVRLRGYSEGGG